MPPNAPSTGTTITNEEKENAMDTYHVSPATDGWELRKVGAERASKRSATKQELVGSLAEFFEGKTASVKIHKADGTIEEERTYPRAADPRRSKG